MPLNHDLLILTGIFLLISGLSLFLISYDDVEMRDEEVRENVERGWFCCLPTAFLGAVLIFIGLHAQQKSNKIWR